ncbi:glycosyl transferase [Bacteroidia bacterium]|nr:glycosyl transferase [Bacteroidia bacterium]
MKKIAVIILNWNGSKLLNMFLPSVVKYSPADLANIYVADNGSTDDSISLLQEKFPFVNVITLDKNYGFAEGYNLAIKQVDAEYIVLLNSDVEVTQGWLDAPLEILERDKAIACVQPKILSWKNQAFFEYAGAAGGFIDRYGYPFCRGRIFDVVEENLGQYDTEIDTMWASGACLFIRTDVYCKEGGLDARFFAHQEEVDLCWRLRCRGYRVVYTPRSVVYHIGGATLQAGHPRKTFLNFRNSLLMIYKNTAQKDLRKVLNFRFWLDYIAAAKFLFSGHWKDARAVYKARREFHKLKRVYLPARKENLAKTVPNPIPELMQKSIIIAFYLKGKKKYFEL